MFEFKAGDTVSLTGIVSQVLMGPRYQISVKTSLGDDTVEVYAYPQVMTLVKARPIQVGDIVRHPNFGEDGFKVIAIDKDEAWAIRIKDGKRMTLWYASLEPVPPRGR